MKDFLYYLQMTILVIVGVTVFVFFGAVSQVYFELYNPDFYYWSIAFYVFAGIFGIGFIIYAFKTDKARRRAKSKKQPPVPARKSYASSSTTTKHRAPSPTKKKGRKK